VNRLRRNASWAASSRFPVLLILVARPPARKLVRLICQATHTCDARARVLVLPARAFLPRGRTTVHVLGAWNCPRRRVLDTLARLFCQEAACHG
jgi:hypothetical protein